jgi:Flp pilus assembly pilin Flp
VGSDRPSRQEGQGLVEYGLILVIVAVVCVVSLLFFGDQLSSLLQIITSAV